MADLTTVGDTVELVVPDRGVSVDVAISGTYEMVIALQKEVASEKSGVWQNVPEFFYDAHDDTIAATYVTQGFGESLRMIVLEDTDGTATVTLTAQDKQLQSIVDDVGTVLGEYKQSGVLFDGQYVKRSPVSLTGDVTLTAEDHANRPLLLDIASGLTATLPTATGSGDEYKFVVTTAISSNEYNINAANDTDSMLGHALVADNADATNSTFQAVSTTDAVVFDSADPSTGGQVGDTVELTDIGSNTWAVRVIALGDAAQATPFVNNS